MTIFCTAITSLILIALSIICLFISENSLKKNMEPDFLKEINSMITHVQNQNYLSLQWINQLQENNHFLVYFYDNGTPLYSQRLYSDAAGDALAETAITYAIAHYGINIRSANSNVLPEHVEFQLADASGTSYYVSAGTIPRSKNTLGFVVLYSLAKQQQQIFSQRVLFAALDLAAIFLLTLFAWFFTGRMLLPLEENRRNQTHFIASASHELRTPLAVILSGADALGKAESLTEREHFLHIIRTEGIRMQHLISDMLFLARSDAGNFPITAKSCQPDLLLMDAYEKFELSAHKKKLSLSLSMPEEQLSPCFCDSERVAQVFSILLDNALSYTPAGGSIVLSLSPDPKHSALCYGVSDNGPGVPDEEKELVFDRFYRAESSHTDKNHFGLGLCIAREIITAHHGKLWIADTPGGGATFFFTLPVR